ncbi:MAG: RluA family pseudouridine synthase [Lentisphaerae bacterium]|jgi:23S rRNA pseudouridine1911/1915/1917 synthase|nr:RluA family pseudouridine synthase [Lentisphaerota bacterium]
MDIVYLDNHLMVVEKPHGLLTQPSGTSLPSLEEQAKNYIKTTFGKPGNVFLEAVHRIDRQVAGLVLFARTSKALARMNQQIRDGNCQKTYHAIVQGCPKDNQQTLENWILHDDFKAKIVTHKTKDAKIAILQFRVIKRLGANTLLEINLETGRYHQIRAQLAHIGCPILGDEKYGATTPFKDNAIALQHKMLTVLHPISKEQITFVANHNLEQRNR